MPGLQPTVLSWIMDPEEMPRAPCKGEEGASSEIQRHGTGREKWVLTKIRNEQI